MDENDPTDITIHGADRAGGGGAVVALDRGTAISDEDRAALAHAIAVLDRPRLASRLQAMLGRQFDWAAQAALPAPVLAAVNNATLAALRMALRVAIRSLRGEPEDRPARSRLHLTAAALSGAAGGAFGLAALPLELPLSTAIMMRAIADIARAEGENLNDPETALACLEVFALGSGAENGPAGESGYLAMRSMLARSVSEAARLFVRKGVVDETAPVIMRLLSQIASRFGAAVGQKAMTQAVPVIGAAAGAAVNSLFTDHFQAIARAHFTVRRLERRYGAERIRILFARMRDEETTSSERDQHAPEAISR